MDSPLVVIQITDPHLLADPDERLLGVNTDTSLRGVIDTVHAREPSIDLVLATGDITQDGSVTGYQRFLQHISRLGAPVHGLPGNHDRLDPFRTAWGDRLNPIVDIGCWRIILLDSSAVDSNAGHLAADQLALLHRAATQAGERHTLVALHHNPVPMGCTWLDSTKLDNGDALLDCIEPLANVRGVLWGHVHQEYDMIYRYAPREGRASARTLRLLASPSTCIQFKPHSPTFELDTIAPAYRRLELHTDGSIQTHVTRVEGLAIEPDLGSRGY